MSKEHNFAEILELTAEERKELLAEWKKRKAPCINADQSQMQETR